jgi:signal transduction histidine kinase
MGSRRVFRRYRELQDYVGWTEEDAHRVAAIASALEPSLPALIDDFYAAIEGHPAANRVITGGAVQVERLKGTLLQWVRELLGGRYDGGYVERRWRVGWRHVEIGLDQVYTNVALSRLRTGLVRALRDSWPEGAPGLTETAVSIHKLLDLDLAIIEDAYQAEYVARLQRNERLATLGQVAGGIAHELRNPLNVVKTSVYYLLNARNPPPEKRDEHLRRIERHVGLADGVITTLSNFARMPLPQLVPVALESCVRESVEDNPPGAGIAVELSFAPGLPPALADGDQLRIVFGNLIRNARDAMPTGGRLSVVARPVGEGVEVDVADTGVGIPPGDLARVMEPLYSTKARGLGLGLAISRTVLEKMGARLRVESEPGQGSTFTITLKATTDGP